MGFNWTVVLVISLAWAFVGIVLPIVWPKGPNRGIIQTCLVITAVTCYTMWLVTYVAQLNPLFGPQLSASTLRLIEHNWK